MQQAAVLGSKAVVIVILLISLVGQIVVIPVLAAETVAQFPEAEYLRVPGILGCVAIVLCVQVAMVCIWRLLSMVATSRVFHASAFAMVSVMIGCGAAATILFFVAFVVLSAANVMNQGLIILLGAGFVGGLGFSMLLVVMRGLLRKATQLEQDMAEVV